jgi:hypothetical protein
MDFMLENTSSRAIAEVVEGASPATLAGRFTHLRKVHDVYTEICNLEVPYIHTSCVSW